MELTLLKLIKAANSLRRHVTVHSCSDGKTGKIVFVARISCPETQNICITLLFNMHDIIASSNDNNFNDEFFDELGNNFS